MYLTSGQIRYLLRTLTPPLIEPLPLHQADNPGEYTKAWEKRCAFIEGNAFDLTVDQVMYLTSADFSRGAPFIGRETRRLPAWRQLEQEFCGSDRYLVTSQETINLPTWIRAEIWQRTSFISAACNEPCSRVAPGFSGRIRTGLAVQYALQLERGARHVAIEFYAYYVPEEYREIYLYEREIDIYSGIWGGTKTDTGGKDERGF